MYKHWLFIGLFAVASGVDAQSSSTSASRRAALPVAPLADSLSALRLQYVSQINELVPQWRAAKRAAAVADSLKLAALPTDTIRAGTMLWLVDADQTPNVPEAVTRAWDDLVRVFGDEMQQFQGRTFAARVREVDSTRRILDLGEVRPGRLDMFDRVRVKSSAAALATAITTQLSRLIFQKGDPAVLAWLGEPFVPAQLKKSARQDMYVDLVTAPSQVASRCLAGDLQRCRDALGLVSVTDPISEWYDAQERRMLVMRMREQLSGGPQRSQFDECSLRKAYAVCDRILRTIPRYVPPSPLPTSARLYLFRVALETGGKGAYSRLVAGTSNSVEDRLAAAAGVPIDTLVATWRADIMGAQPPSPAPSMLSIWTAVGWGVAAMVIALRFAAWR